jgi:hypothetical protein
LGWPPSGADVGPHQWPMVIVAGAPSQRGAL